MAHLINEIVVRQDEPRQCIFKDADGEKRAFLHSLTVEAWTHGASATIGGFSTGQESHLMANIELEDGTIRQVCPKDIRLLDSKRKFGEYTWVVE